jgi:hypothetical protein
MGWRDFSPEKQTGAFEPFETGGSKMKTFETLRVLPIKAILNNNNISDFNHLNFSALPLKSLKTLKRGQDPELKTVWTNPFPLGSREAREESRRIVDLGPEPDWGELLDTGFDLGVEPDWDDLIKKE